MPEILQHQPLTKGNWSTQACNAADVMGRIAEQYRTCSTYYDTGEVSDYSGTVRFSTYFRRPDFFRFEWVDVRRSLDALSGFIWQKDDTVLHRGLYDSETSRIKDLNKAIAISTGCTGGAAHVIVSLLLPQLIGGTRYLADRFELSSHKGQSELLQLVSSDNDMEQTELWVDTSLLIRKIKIPLPDVLGGLESQSVYSFTSVGMNLAFHDSISELVPDAQ